jgi:hypothetical protein
MGYPSNQPAGALSSGQLGGGSNAYVDGDAVKVVDAAGNIRVYLGNIPNGDYGLQVISSDGSTVIIDGTSDVFKILASGVFSDTNPGATNSHDNLQTLTGLGTFAATPAHLSFVSNGNGVTDWKHLGTFMLFNDLYASQSSGGTGPWQKFRAINVIAVARASLNGSNQVVVSVVNDKADAGAMTFYNKYFVLMQTAM